MIMSVMQYHLRNRPMESGDEIHRRRSALQPRIPNQTPTIPIDQYTTALNTTCARSSKLGRKHNMSEHDSPPRMYTAKTSSAHVPRGLELRTVVTWSKKAAALLTLPLVQSRQ